MSRPTCLEKRPNLFFLGHEKAKPGNPPPLSTRFTGAPCLIEGPADDAAGRELPVPDVPGHQAQRPGPALPWRRRSAASASAAAAAAGGGRDGGPGGGEGRGQEQRKLKLNERQFERQFLCWLMTGRAL